MVVIAKFSLPSTTSIYLLIYVGVADVISNRVIEAAAQCFQAVGRMKYTAVILVAPSVTRTAYALYQHAVTPRADARQWAFDYMVATIVPAAVSVWLVGSQIGWPKLMLRDIREHMVEGVFFSISLSSQTIYNDIDKTMLARLSTLDAAGIYMTAYRIIDMSFMPVRSLAQATFTQFFREGQKGVRSSFSYAKRQLPRAVAYGTGVGIFLFLIAPVIPKILGSEYARSVEALRLLALLPLLKSIHYFLALTLTGADYQKIRAFVQVGIAVLNIGANLWLMPVYSWRGAAWISIACDGSLVVGLYIALLICRYKEDALARHSDGALHKQTS
jgi:O-antigen/teichoic acid export membrane protein